MTARHNIEYLCQSTKNENNKVNYLKKKKKKRSLPAWWGKKFPPANRKQTIFFKWPHYVFARLYGMPFFKDLYSSGQMLSSRDKKIFRYMKCNWI